MSIELNAVREVLHGTGEVTLLVSDGAAVEICGYEVVVEGNSPIQVPQGVVDAVETNQNLSPVGQHPRIVGGSSARFISLSAALI